MGGSAVPGAPIPYTILRSAADRSAHHRSRSTGVRLIGHVVPDGQALDKALEIASDLNNGPLAVQAILRSIRGDRGLHENDAFKIDTRSASRSS